MRREINKWRPAVRWWRRRSVLVRYGLLAAVSSGGFLLLVAAGDGAWVLLGALLSATYYGVSWVAVRESDGDLKAEQARRRALRGPDGAVPLTELVTADLATPFSNRRGWVDGLLDLYEAVAEKSPPPARLPAASSAGLSPEAAKREEAPPSPSSARPIVESGRRWTRRAQPGSIVQ